MGAPLDWIEAHADYPHKDWCLLWPFFRDKNGRGVVSLDGKRHYAHRAMCRRVSGEPPAEDHGTAHSCGNGHLGCINPHHLSWKTQADNLKDCAKHGTQPKTYIGPRGHFSMEEVAEIRRQLKTRTQLSIAHQYQVTESTISDIARGRYYARPPKLNYWEPEEDAKMRAMAAEGKSFVQIAEALNRSHKSVVARAHRERIKSGHLMQNGHS
jgi:hypothetical protein